MAKRAHTLSSVVGYPHLFGPVYSRRLGRSLGVDLLPHKTCSLMVQALEPLPVFAVPSRRPGDGRRIDDQEVEQAILARLEHRTHDTTTLAFLLGLNEGMVANAVQRMIDDGRLARVPSAQKKRLVVERAQLKAGVEGVG